MDAPVPVKITLSPVHTVVFVALATTVGNEFNVTNTFAVFLQPFASVPVTVYVFVTLGTKKQHL